MTFSNDNDYISFRHHVYVKAANQVELAEVGPRFEMRRKFFFVYIYVVTLG
jgi:U3 small nucleolar ribonucleoprotein protein IMP4